MESRKKSIKSQLILIIPIITVLMWLTVTFNNLRIVEKNINKATGSEIRLWLNSLHHLIINDMRTGSYAKMRRILKGIIDNNVLSFVEIRNADNNVIFSWPENKDNIRPKNIKEDILSHEQLDVSNGSIVNYFMPIRDEYGSVWGKLIFRLPEKTYFKTIEGVRRKNLMFGLGILLVELALIIFVVGKIFDPLEEMTDGLKSLAARLPNVEDYIAPLRDIVEKSRGSEAAMLGNQVLSFLDRLLFFKEQNEKLSTMAAIGQTTAMVAHDVRKPLASMKALLYTLPKVKSDPESINRMMSVVDQNIAQTDLLLEDILEFSKDSKALKNDKHDVKSLISASTGEALIDKIDADVSVEYFLKHTGYLYVDSKRIIRVLVNIVSNAVEAMSRKGKLWFKTEDLADDKLRIFVGNNGPKIHEDQIKKIFDLFYTYNKKGGTGLGLAICQRIVEMHGGKISVENCEEGVEFALELPAKKGNLSVDDQDLIKHSSELKLFYEEASQRIEYGDTTNIAEFMRLHKKMGRALSLLIVDDEPLFRESIRGLLQQMPQIKDHVRVVEAGNASVAEGLLAENQFDYLIADIDLGADSINGYQLTEKVLKDYKDIYVIIHSNKRRGELDEKIRAGKSKRFLGFLPKPMKHSQLLQFLARKSFERQKEEKKLLRKNVLVLNDDYIFILVMKNMINASEVKIFEATNFDKALEQYKNNKIDIIISDINLGDRQPTGYDFLKKIREENKNIPFFVVSGYGLNEKEKAIKLGANGYYQSPLELKQLRQIIKSG